MQIGCFALVEPFLPVAQQFQRIREMGFDYADLTDNHNGGMLGVEFGFGESLSLDSHPADIRKMVADAGLTLTAVCAHANLLDPPSPARYGTHELIKAIRLAHDLGVKQIITTEGDAKTDFGHGLTHEQRLFAVQEKLHEPLRWAEELDRQILIEPHGVLTDTIEGMQDLLQALGRPERIGVNLDTGNFWLGGGDPVQFVRTFGQRIAHVHWKDMGPEWEPKRGTMFGCGMTTTPVGEGLVGAQGIVEALKEVGFDGPTTLEIAGEDNLKKSADQLRAWGA